jgi:Trypsin
MLARRRFIRGSGCLVGLAAILALVGPAHPASAITGAPVTTLAPWAVGLEFRPIRPGPNAETHRCTGTTLSQHWILTAAHCLAGKSNESHEAVVYADEYEDFRLMYQGKASFYNHPDYDGGTYVGLGRADRGDDLGLVRLYGDGLVPDFRAKIENGPKVADPDRWKDGASIFFVSGFGKGTDVGAADDCDGAPSGVKRIGRFKLTGNTDDNGTFGLGNPIAVEADRIGHTACQGDSGAPWSFADGANPANEMRVFAVHSGDGLFSNPLLGGDEWGALVPARLAWMIDKSADKQAPLNCASNRERGEYGSYRRCAEGYWLMSRGASSGPTRLESLSTPLSRVHFADFDGDGKAGDAFVSAGGGWYVFYSDRTSGCRYESRIRASSRSASATSTATERRTRSARSAARTGTSPTRHATEPGGVTGAK